ncbi:MAG: DUF1553 domain-containing protein [Gemmataceae bacterium]|nr:DUF1553 domain-containing protein [Gemmataceae bacterium]
MRNHGAILRLTFPATLLALLLGIGGMLSAAEVSPSAASKVDFAREIRPILSDRCFHCHGPDEKNRKGAFRLDQEKSALGRAESGEHPIVPGKPEVSELVRRITATDTDERMPPPDSGKTLSKRDIELLRAWVQQGAKWQEHWAFVRPVRLPLPPVKDERWPRGVIDRWVLARLEAEGLKPSPEAARQTLIRRVTFDLTGLPPTLQEIDAFIADRSEHAYEALVDRLLASPHYGERVASQWLDGARFADTNGYQNDFTRDMWPWRDWLIRACNDNMRYDEFILEQLAGDLLQNATPSQKIATGFLRNNRSVTEGGSIAEEWRVENIIDRVETTSVVMLGLTMGCARCHDHKYDPISQREFYRFFAIFNGTKDEGFYSEARGNTGPIVRVMPADQERRVVELDAAIAKAERESASQQAPEFAAWAKSLRDKSSPLPAPATILGLSMRGDLRITQGKNPHPVGQPLLVKYEGGAPRWGSGLAGQALELAGEPASHVTLGEAVHLDRDSKFSLACWVHPDGEGALWSKMDDAAAYRGFDTLVYDGGRIELHLIHHWADNAIKITTRSTLRMGQWNHVCVTYDGSSKAEGIKVYIDGQPVPLDVNANSLSATIATGQPFRVGRRSASLFFKGALSDFAAYDLTLTAEEASAVVESSLAAAMHSPESAGSLNALREYFAAHFSAAKQPQSPLAKLRAEKDEYLKKVNKAPLPTVMVLEETEKPRPTYLLKRGQYDAPDKNQSLEPGVPTFLPPLPSGAAANRLGLAKWLIDPAHPLVARVEVNRLWARFFGRGLAATLDNFGFQGDPPTNPELLDWMATEFVRLDWDVKALEKEIVMSATYRQASAVSVALAERDPENRLLARGPRHRLQAEEIRDNALAIGGLLSLKIGGPSVKPYQPAGLWEELAGGAGQGGYQQDSGENLHRRSLYTYRKRTVPHPTTSTFDAPTWEFCTVKRSRTNTPLQALALLNDATYVEAARGLAQRMMLEGGSELEGRLRYGFRLATGRQPGAKEIERLSATCRRLHDSFRQDPAAAKSLLAVGEFLADAHLNKAELAAYATVGSILLNLDETITKQ